MLDFSFCLGSLCYKNNLKIEDLVTLRNSCEIKQVG